MEHEKEARLAAILWRFIEESRERKQPGEVLRLAPGEAHELLELLTFAASVGNALVTTESPAGYPAELGEHERARRRLELALLERPTGPRTEAGARPVRRPATLIGLPLASSTHFVDTRRFARVPGSRSRSRWAWGTVAAAAALAVGLVGVQVGRSLPPPDPLTHPPASVLALSHTQVQQLLPRLLKGQLSPQQSRAMWWHLAHCDDCFHAYEQMRGHAPSALPSGGTRMIGARDGPTKRGEPPTFISLRLGGHELSVQHSG